MVQVRIRFTFYDWTVYSHLVAIQANLQRYQGDEYEGSPLDDADEIAKQALMQFPGELGDERRRVEDARLKIQELKAQRDWSMGQYYDKKKQYGAARHYYQNVLSKFPETSFAKRAAGRLEAIRDRPAEPKDRFKWLNDIFPSHD